MAVILFCRESKMSEENLKTNDQVNPDAASDVPTLKTADGGSGSTPCSFSAINRYTFKGWIESHNPDFKWNWSNPESVKENLIEFIRSGGHINLEPVFNVFFGQGYSGLDMTLGSEETIWAVYLGISNEV